MSPLSRKSEWKSPVVLSFWKAVGGRNPHDSVIRVCDEMKGLLKTKEPPFQSSGYEYAKAIGVRVIEKELADQKVNGVLSMCGNEFLIMIDKGDSPERRSFTVCHEVGHIQMLQKASREMGRNRVLNYLTGSFEEEVLSNAFAANLLMPRKEFKNACKELPPSLDSLLKIAKTFRTSVEAAALRIVDLDIWPCLVFRCALEAQHLGGHALRVKTPKYSKSLNDPPITRDSLIRWGVDCVAKACQNEGLSNGRIEFTRPGVDDIERWSFECVFTGGRCREPVLALMLRLP